MKKVGLILVLALLIIGLMPIIPVSAMGNEPPTDALYFSKVIAQRNTHYLEHTSYLDVYVTNPTASPITTNVDFWVYCAENLELREYTKALWAIPAYSTVNYLWSYDVHLYPGFYWFTITSVDIEVAVAGYMEEHVTYPDTQNRARALSVPLFVEVGASPTMSLTVGRTASVTPYSISYWIGSRFRWLFEGSTVGGNWSQYLDPDVIGETLVTVMTNNLGFSDLGIGVWVNVYGEIDIVCNKLYPDYRVQLIDKFVTFWAELENTGTAYGTVAISLYITDTNQNRIEYTTKEVSFGLGDKKLIQFEAYQVGVVGVYIADVLDRTFMFWCNNDRMFVEEYDPDDPENGGYDPDDDPWIDIDDDPFITLPEGLGSMAKAVITLVLVGGVGFITHRQFRRRWLTILGSVATLGLTIFIGWCPIWLTITFALLLSLYIIKKVVLK